MSDKKRRPCGPRGLQISHLGLGGAPLGRAADIPGSASAEAAEDERGARTLEAAYRLGIRHVDTSPGYGESERRLGIAVRRNHWPDLTISTKVGTHPQRKFSYSGDDIRWSLENSLRLFDRDHVDIALIHDPPSMDSLFERGNGFDALRVLREEGLCRNVGLGVQSHEFHRRAIDAGVVDVILTYGDFNIVRRSGLDLMRHAKSKGVGVLLGSPMMHGLLAIDDEPLKTVERQPRLLNWYPRSDFEEAQRWHIWCREHEVSLRHLNMRFVMSSDLADCVLTGARDEDELKTNVREAAMTVPDDVWADALARIEDLDAVSGRDSAS